MGVKKRVNKYPRAFQLMALERMKGCRGSAQICAQRRFSSLHPANTFVGAQTLDIRISRRRVSQRR